MRIFLFMLCLSLTLGCEKKTEKGQQPTVTKTSSAQQAPVPNPQPENAEPEASEPKPAEKKAEEKKIYGEPRDLDREYDRATLEKAYVEIDCVRLENNPAKLEAVFNKYGFNHPKLWTAAWAKASKDKEWVAKLVLAAHTACPRPKPTEGEPKAKPAEKQP